MIYPRSDFGAVGMGNKLVAIGGARSGLTYNSESNGEIFDSHSRKFTIIKEMQDIFREKLYLFDVKLFANGCNVFICSSSSKCKLRKYLFYDVINNKWESKSTELM